MTTQLPTLSPNGARWIQSSAVVAAALAVIALWASIDGRIKTQETTTATLTVVVSNAVDVIGQLQARQESLASEQRQVGILEERVANLTARLSENSAVVANLAVQVGTLASQLRQARAASTDLAANEP